MAGPVGNEVSFKLDSEALEGMIREQIATHVGIALAGNGEAFVQKLVKETLDFKVDDRGKPDRYGRGQTFATYVTRNIIQEAVKDAVSEWTEANKAKIKREVKKQLSQHPDNFLEKFAEESAEGLAKSLRFSYNASVHVVGRDDD